ncbi:lipocalin family protein [Flavobacterium sp. H122]|uniref:lipocalin family protein n=1 Tax=Flavobacterium sp. H122 TaxID=2529860 RepID=UPI0010A9B5C7|nr:lipocalin family protein [Flavobacterium sp. H122]
MKRLLISLLGLFFFSCVEKVEVSELNHLNGYWQIAKVETAEGEEKEYKANENYDYFEFKNKTGFHKKVRWQPNGKFLTDDLQEQIQTVENKDGLYLEFSSSFGKHKDKVVKISDKELVLEAENGNENYYSKVDVNGETTK